MASQDFCKGMEVDCGYMSRFFINNYESKICELNNPLIMLVTKRLSRIDIAEMGLTLAKKSRRPLLIVAEGVRLDVLISLIWAQRHGAKVCVARAFGDEEHRRSILMDIAVLTHSSLLTEHFCTNVKLELDMLGSCETVKISEGKAHVLNGKGNEKAIELHYKDLIFGLASCTTKHEQQNVLQRLDELSGGLPVRSAFRKTLVKLRVKAAAALHDVGEGS